MEKVSSYFPLPLPLHFSPPPVLSSQVPSPIPDPLLPPISLINYQREGDPLIVFVPPQPLAHRVHPPVPSILPCPPPSPPLLLFPCVACRMPRCSLDFCFESHFDLCTYAALYPNITLSRLSRLAPPSPTLRMQCHISFVTSPNYPFVFCNHNFSSFSFIAFVCHFRMSRRPSPLEWDNLALLHFAPITHIFASDRRILDGRFRPRSTWAQGEWQQSQISILE